VWLSRRSSLDYAGFLVYLWELGDLDCEIIDTTDFLVVSPEMPGRAPAYHPATSLGVIGAKQIVSSGLLDQARPIVPAAREEYRILWKRLRTENASLRVIDANLNLVSAPFSFFDSKILSLVSTEWQKAALVVGKTMASEWDDHLFQVGDLVLAARLRALADAGLVEPRGDLFMIRHSEVRLPVSV
jgi:hypothetical protein